jgi:uncharacterized membrane protein
MKFSWRTEWPFWLVLAGMFALAWMSWSVVHERIPVHWGLDGAPDRWGGRFEGLMVVPLVALVIYFVMLLVPRIDPGRANYASFAPAYNTVRMLVLLVLAVVQVFTLLQYRGRVTNMEVIGPLLAGIVFLVTGNVMGKLRPNWFVGIRTPWTLSSKESWMRTHRAGGWVFIASGIVMLIVALFRPQWFVAVLVGWMLPSTLGLVVYSYIVWKNDPEKTPPAGTTPAQS